MRKRAGKKRNLFHIINYIVLALTIITSVYIMANGMGLVDSLDFGAGAYYYADIPEFSKYTDGTWYTSPVSMQVLIALFIIWGIFMYKIWGWIEKKDDHRGVSEKRGINQLIPDLSKGLFKLY